MEKNQYLALSEFFLVLTKFYFWEDWTLSCNLVKL